MITASEIGNAMIEAAKVSSLGMTVDQADTLLSILSCGPEFAIPEDKRADAPFGFKIADARLRAHEVPCDDGVLLMITALCDRPGNILLYCAVVKALYDKKGSPITLKDFFGLDAMGLGVVPEEELKRIWLSQKTNDGKSPDNWLDRVEAWKSTS